MQEENIKVDDMKKSEVLELSHDDITDLVIFYKDKYNKCKIKASKEAIERLDNLYDRLVKGV